MLPRLTLETGHVIDAVLVVPDTDPENTPPDRDPTPPDGTVWETLINRLRPASD